eukprot:114555-Amphidinium_carterae.1
MSLRVEAIQHTHGREWNHGASASTLTQTNSNTLVRSPVQNVIPLRMGGLKSPGNWHLLADLLDSKRRLASRRMHLHQKTFS